ncbi:MAG: glycosyltransferase [Ilumatobacteraceae bacterium]|nr:glycosyltransferase [Ilumatobacteraceae bacterium]
MSDVFVSVGTDHHPFERMLDWAEMLHGQLGLDVLVQRGATPARNNLRSVDYLSQPDLRAELSSTKSVVCHGGPGTIAVAMEHGHRPVVVPRNPSRGEHVDDHQMRYAAELERQGVIDIARSSVDLIRMLSEPRPVSVPDVSRSTAAVSEFERLVGDLLAGTAPKRRLRDRVLIRRTK